MKLEKRNPACGGRDRNSTVHLGGWNNSKGNLPPLSFQALSPDCEDGDSFVALGQLASIVVLRLSLRMLEAAS